MSHFKVFSYYSYFFPNKMFDWFILDILSNHPSFFMIMLVQKFSGRFNLFTTPSQVNLNLRSTTV